MSETTTAWAEMLELLEAAATEHSSERRGSTTDDEVAEAHRNVMHILQAALVFHAEADPLHPVFSRIVSPTRKFTGDNADAVYFEAEISGAHTYLIKGNMAGAAYTSFTVEAGAAGGAYATRTAGVLNDIDIDVDEGGNYEVTLGGPEQSSNWLALPDDAGRITTRHYFEWPEPAAASQTLTVPLSIELVGDVPPPPVPGDAQVAEMIRRVTTHVRGKTLDQPVRGTYPLPDWVGQTANVLPNPEPPGDMAFSAFDAYYTMCPFELAPDEALVMTGRWPDCRFGNVCIWNSVSQTLDYVNRPVARNRSNTVLNDDGTFTMVLTHNDTGVGNWLDTEGRRKGTIFWRFFLVDGAVEPIRAEVVKVASLG